MTPDDIITKIQDIRAENNLNWMDILRIAVKHAPRETMQAMERIHYRDMEINQTFRRLMKCLEQTLPSSR